MSCIRKDPWIKRQCPCNCVGAYSLQENENNKSPYVIMWWGILKGWTNFCEKTEEEKVPMDLIRKEEGFKGSLCEMGIKAWLKVWPWDMRGDISTESILVSRHDLSNSNCSFLLKRFHISHPVLRALHDLNQPSNSHLWKVLSFIEQMPFECILCAK